MYFYKTNIDHIYLCHSLFPPVASIVLSRVCIVTVLVYLLSRMMIAQKEPSEQVKVSLCFQYHVTWKVEAPQCFKSHATWTLEDPQYYNTAYTAQNGRLKFTLLHTSCKMEGWSSNMLPCARKGSISPTCCKCRATWELLSRQWSWTSTMLNILQIPCTLRSSCSKMLQKKTCKMKGCCSKMLRMQHAKL